MLARIMNMLSLVCLILAALLFLFAAFGVPSPRPALTPLGLFFLVLAQLLPMILK